MSPKIASQLQLRGIDAITVRDLGMLGNLDSTHLQKATELGRVLVTGDADFLHLAAEGFQHAGIIFGIQGENSVGDWVKKLELVCFVYSADELTNHIEYL